MSRSRRIVLTVLVVVGTLAAAAYVGIAAAIRDYRHWSYLQELAPFQDPNVADLLDWPGKEAYRFLWIHAFGPRVVVTVFVHEDSSGVLHMNVADSNEPSREWVDPRISLNADDIQSLRHVVDSNQFWKARVPLGFGLDGAIWWVEVKRGKEYHRDQQWSPEQGSIRNIGLHLMRLSRSGIEQEML